MPPKRAPEDDDDEYFPGMELTKEEVKAQKKRKKRKFSFLDIEAEEDDAENEEDDEDLQDLIADDDDADYITERQQAKAQRMMRKKELAEDPREFLRQLEQRYHADVSSDEDYKLSAPPDISGIEQQQFLPTFRDPRLFMVKIQKPHKERLAVYTLLQKHLNLLKKGLDLGISSAVIPEHQRGRVYVEARTISEVEQAIHGLDLFNLNAGVEAVQVEEMPDVLKITKKVNSLKPFDWVRIPSGEYKNDLAQVVSIHENYPSKCSIRVIPRLDIQHERALMHDLYDEEDPIENLNENEYENVNENVDGITNENGQRSKKKSKPVLALGTKKRGRPPQRLFNKEEIYRLTSAADMHAIRLDETGEIFEVWNRQYFRYGLLYLDMPIKKLVKGKDVQPQIEEIEKWIAVEKAMRLAYDKDRDIMTPGEARRGLQLKISAATADFNVGLFKSDRVRVIKGEQKGLDGVILNLDGDTAIIKSEDLPEPLKVKRAYVVKTFNLGENVKVAAGKYAGESGAIVSVDNEFLTIFTDSTRKEIRVLSTHVADSLDITTENASKLAQKSKIHFATFDLVELIHDNSKAVVVKVMNDSVAVLDTQNIVKNVPFTAIKSKLTDRWARSHDSRGNPIAQNDSIHVTSGPSKHRHGVVLHVSGQNVFFRAQDEVNDACGVIVCLASSVDASTAASKRRKDFAGLAPALIPKTSLSALGAGGIIDPRQPYRGYSGPVNTKDPYFRKEVKVIKGLWKGYIGVIVFADSKHLRVQLSANMRTVTVDRNKVKIFNHPGVIQTEPPRPNAQDGVNNAGTENGTQNSTADALKTTHPFGSRTPRDRNYMEGPDTQSVCRTFQTPVPPDRNRFALTPFGPSTGNDEFRPTTPHHSEVPVANPYNTPLPSTLGQTSEEPTTTSADAYAQYGATNSSAFGAASKSTEKKSVTTQAPFRSDEIAEPHSFSTTQNEPVTPALTLEPNTPVPVSEHVEPVEPKTPNVELPAADAISGYRVLVDVVVSIASDDNHLAVVKDAVVDGSSIHVTMLNGPNKDQSRSVQGTDITPMQPSIEIDEIRPELVKVLDGDHKGKIATLIQIKGSEEDPDGIVRFDSGELGDLSLSLVAKCKLS